MMIGASPYLLVITNFGLSFRPAFTNQTSSQSRYDRYTRKSLSTSNMNSGLEIGVSKYLFGMDVPSNGVIANIYALDPDKDANSKRNVVIPIGNGAPLKRVELKPGRYLVEAILPSGNIITKQAKAVDGKWPKVVLQAERSAHEWHSWQNLLGNVQSQTGYNASSGNTSIPDYNVRLIKRPLSPLQSGSRDASESWRVFHELLSPRFAHHFLSRPPLAITRRVAAVQHDGATQLHSFVMNYDGSLTGRVSRWYLIVETPRATRLLTMPAPWFSMVGKEIPLELLITKSPDRSIKTSWVVKDLNLGTVLGYLARGAFDSALNVGSYDSALNMLFEKYTNPLGAAAGGYVLIGSMKPDEKQDWHHWIENLRRDFKWLPDGAIQSAWLKLKQGNLESNRRKVRDALFEAYDRGFPYFSLGLQWLINGLTLLGDEDDDAQLRLKRAQQVAWRSDMSNLFTTFDLRR
jgi:hypothetical protein